MLESDMSGHSSSSPAGHPERDGGSSQKTVTLREFLQSALGWGQGWEVTVAPKNAVKQKSQLNQKRTVKSKKK